MKIVAECPGMCSDRPGITLNTLDLEVSPTCLREKERELLDEVCGLVGVTGTHIISQIWPTPLLCAGADCPRYPGGPSASEIFDTDTRLELPLVNSSQHRRIVRRPTPDRPLLAQWQTTGVSEDCRMNR